MNHRIEFKDLLNRIGKARYSAFHNRLSIDNFTSGYLKALDDVTIIVYELLISSKMEQLSEDMLNYVCQNCCKYAENCETEADLDKECMNCPIEKLQEDVKHGF